MTGLIDSYKFCPNCKSDLKTENIGYQDIKRCNSCDFVFWNNPKPTVSILMSKNGKVLLLRRASEPFKGGWCLPGGFIGWNETAEEALIRETREEIGLTPTVGNIIGAYKIDNDPRGMHVDIIYEGEAHGEVKLSLEHDSYDYFDPEHLPTNTEYKHPEAVRDWSKK